MTKRLLRYGDAIRLETEVSLGSYLQMRPETDFVLHAYGEILAGPVPAAPETDAEIRIARCATWRILPGRENPATLGQPVFLGERVTLMNLAEESHAWGLRPEHHMTVAPPGDQNPRAMGVQVGFGDQMEWVFTAPGNPVGDSPMVADAPLPYQLQQVETKLFLYTAGHARWTGVGVYATNGALTRGWRISTHPEVEGLRRSDESRDEPPNMPKADFGPQDIYDAVGEYAIGKAHEWVSAGRPHAIANAASAEIRSRSEKLTANFPSVRDRTLDGFVASIWENATALAQAPDAERPERKKQFYLNAMNRVLNMSRRYTSQSERQDRFDKLAILLDQDPAGKAEFTRFAAPFLQDQLPELTLPGDIPETPRDTRRRRSADSGTPVTIPQTHEMPLWIDISLGFLSFINPMFGPVLNLSRAVAAAFRITLGVGQEYSGGAGLGGSFGGGLLVTSNGRLGIYGSVSAAAGAMFSVSATWQWTFVIGDTARFAGPAYMVSLSGGEVVVINVGLLLDMTTRRPFGATAGFGLGGGSPVEFYASVVNTYIPEFNSG